VNHGGTLVSVQADEDEKDNVVAIMNRYNPINVKERVASWRSEGHADYGDSASRIPTEQTVANNYARADNRSATSRTSSNYPADTNTTYDRASYAAQTNGGYDASGFRSHYQTNYGNSGHTFADYDPAYRYGYTVANDARYRGRNWNDIEADLRRDWNQNHKGSAWEDFKDAVRYSWERTKAAVTS